MQPSPNDVFLCLWVYGVGLSTLTYCWCFYMHLLTYLVNQPIKMSSFSHSEMRLHSWGHPVLHSAAIYCWQSQTLKPFWGFDRGKKALLKEKWLTFGGVISIFFFSNCFPLKSFIYSAKLCYLASLRICWLLTSGAWEVHKRCLRVLSSQCMLDLNTLTTPACTLKHSRTHFIHQFAC